MNESLKQKIQDLRGPIVVFGAGGFIGANLVRAILRVREDCYAVTHQKYIPWRLVELPSKNLVYGDITEPASVGSLFERFDFKTIFDFAAFGAYSRQDDVDLIYKTNVNGLVNILESASTKGFAAFVHAGSSSEYGLNSAAPKENAELLPNSHYAVTKVSASYLLQYYGVVKKQPVINLRFYSVYGPYEEPDRLIPRIIEHGLNGTYPPLVDPEISRDFVYIDDAVEAAILGATEGVKKKPGASVNIATGKKTTIRELAAVVKKICEIKSEPSWSSMQNRTWDLKDWYGNPTQAKEILHWEAATALEEGLRKTLLWQKEQYVLPTSKIATPFGEPRRISAVIACYKDAEAIPVMHRRLTEAFAQMNVDYEIIFVNDASPDNTDEVLASITAKDNHVIAIEHSRNFGSQSAFLSGMQVSTGDAVVLLDGDLQDPPEIIPKFYERWLEGNEVVYGRRVKRETKRVLRASYKVFYKIFRGMSYVPIPLDAGDFSLIDKKVVKELLGLPETDQFLRGLRAWVGFKQTGVDYIRPERMFGKTTNNWRKNIWWAKKGILSFSFVPLELLSYFGVILTGVAFLAGIAQIIAKLLYPDTPHGVTTIIVLVLFFGGIQVLAMSLLGEYLIKIFEETKKRPKFIRKAIRFGGRHYKTADDMENFLNRQGR
jgi:nucleoside-diphosphate-sugar epimerase/glycosyltransferase involved in cell wall biosynthesis